MLKALLKKQFLELNAFYFQNKKTGKRRSKGGIIGYAVLYIAIFGLLSVTFFGVGAMLCPALVSLQLEWLYFAMMGLLALLLGVFGDVFNTYAGLYRAKDNELLLSMPVPPGKILLVRMVGVYAMALLYGGLVFVPASVAYWIWCGGITPGKLLCPIAMYLFIALLITTLSCVLGWVVALIASKVKNKSFITVLASLAFLALYYVVYFRINAYLQDFLSHIDAISDTMGGIYPLYLMGKAACGDGLSLLIFAAAVLALFALIYYFMQRSFLRIATMKSSEKKAVYQEKTVKVANARKALLRKELKRFLSSPTYMLNCGMGIVIAPLLALFALIRMNWLRDILSQLTAQLPLVGELLPVAAAVAVGMLASMNDISAPSVSLEGKNIWLPQSLPVSAWDVLDAKRRLCLYLNAVPTVFLALVMAIVLELDSSAQIYLVLFSVMFVGLNASSGLALNLKHPNLTWTNETVPVKQGSAVAINLFGGWALMMLYGVGGYFVRSYISMDTYLLIGIVALALATRLINRWLINRGAEIFASL